MFSRDCAERPRRRATRRHAGVWATRRPRRLRLEAHHAAGQQLAAELHLRHASRRSATSRSSSSSRPPNAERRPPIRTANVIATLKGHREPRARLRGQQPLRLGRRRSGRRRRHVRHRSAAGGRAHPARQTRCRRRSSSPRSPARKPACSAAASSSAWRRSRRRNIVGALNNDMIGWAGEQPPGQHHPLFERRHPRHLSTARRSSSRTSSSTTRSTTSGTDAAAFYARLGRHRRRHRLPSDPRQPALSPAARLPRDLSIPLITEAAKTTAASIMLMASSPSRLTAATATVKGAGAEVTWAASLEKNVTAYVVRHWSNGQPRDLRVSAPRAALPNARAGDEVWVKAVSSNGMEGWDWQRATVK